MNQSSVHVLAFLAVEAVRRDVSDPRKRHRHDPTSIEPRPGLVGRLRDRLIRGQPRRLSEPGFAASSSWLDDVVPQLAGYPTSR